MVLYLSIYPSIHLSIQSRMNMHGINVFTSYSTSNPSHSPTPIKLPNEWHKKKEMINCPRKWVPRFLQTSNSYLWHLWHQSNMHENIDSTSNQSKIYHIHQNRYDTKRKKLSQEVGTEIFSNQGFLPVTPHIEYAWKYRKQSKTIQNLSHSPESETRQKHLTSRNSWHNGPRDSWMKTCIYR